MSKPDSKILNILMRNGSSQSNRYLTDLDPSQTQLIDLDHEDWVLFAYNLAYQLNFFNEDNIKDGHWADFFNELNLSEASLKFKNTFEQNSIKEALHKTIQEFKDKGDLSPHLTLFMAFIQLLDQSKDRFNDLSKRHLDFYYQNVLQLEKKKPIADSVYVIIELAKQMLQYQIPANTTFNAGKSNDGKPLLYFNPDESSINKIEIEAIRNVFSDSNAINVFRIKDFAEEESDFIKNGENWWPFGYTPDDSLADSNSFKPNLGFILSSPILELKEGKRLIILDFEFHQSISFNINQFKSNVELSISTAKDWIVINPALISQMSSHNRKFILSIELDSNFPPIGILSSVPQLNESPSVKFKVDTNSPTGFSIFRELSSKAIQNIKVNVEVTEVKNILLENDHTQINPQKPFYPFTTRPFKGSSFSFSYPEAFSKHCTFLQLAFDWKNTPEDFANHYQAYIEEAKKPVSSSAFANSIRHAYLLQKEQDNIIKMIKRNKGSIDEQTKKQLEKNEELKQNNTQSTKIVNGAYDFKVSTELLENGIKIRNLNPDSNQLFQNDNNSFRLKLVDQIKNYPTSKIRVNLQNSFLHEIYPKILAMVLTSNDAEKILPNEPYTPLASDLEFSYHAGVDFSSNSNDVSVYHIHPFGIGKMEHKTLLPNSYTPSGKLFLGLKNCKSRDILSLLFQMDEGTEDPLESISSPISWHILSKNKWEKLPDNAILVNETNNFLRSGLVKIALPEILDENNSVFEPNLVWLSATIDTKHNAVSKCFNIHAQAIKLKLKNPLSANHLPEPLPSKTISKIEQRIPQIKGVYQPYESFGGRSIELDRDFYKRASERLRHKQRAITMWDFEQLILEEFPELMIVKCLNHSKPDCFNAPGHVTIVVIPFIKQINLDAITYPRVSRSKLDEIKAFISLHTSPSVELHVINPEYEIVSINVNIVLNKGLDFNHYQAKLNEDLTRHLSPWAFERDRPIDFNREYHRSRIIYFIENLEYISHISKFEMKVNNKIESHSAKPSSPKNILVSDILHSINLSEDHCSKV
ncbi:hypothetical protein ACFOUP_07740 [Belliella kenyensis]|uniref:Baseplate J-like protein n=1 Tax=Belliella kenyensis TaxID=1472724 RepID=A0ABV8EL55_9BACT|nr:hypothetical protein [Belliella kenyensis]MCH7400366.1 hypothetical protein [Belliella kenyensis]MDN3604616.1 hypothetical protein [Belliella kenyensis]